MSRQTDEPMDPAEQQAMADLTAAAQAAEEDPSIPLLPLPTMVQLATMDMPDGQTMVIMRVNTPVGSSTYWLSPNDATSVGESLVAAASGTSQLIKPPSGLVVP